MMTEHNSELLRVIRVEDKMTHTKYMCFVRETRGKAQHGTAGSCAKALLMSTGSAVVRIISITQEDRAMRIHPAF
jgi:hypothetical protein